VIPSYESADFELKGFSLAQNSSEVVYSQNLEFNGLVWRLKVYPNGNGVAKNNYMSVFIELVKGYPGSARYDYRVEMINLADASKSVQREYNSDFEQGECWGYNRFYRIDLLREEGYLDQSDSLHMKFYIRPPTFYQMAKDQANFIKVLKEKEETSRARFQGIVEKIKTFDQNDEDNLHQQFFMSPEEVSEDREVSEASEKWNFEQCRCESEEDVDVE
jgi:tripartite motif-containing protein 37